MVTRTFLLTMAIAASGCNVMFALDPTELAPTMPELDNDGDGVINRDDNCVLVANADQADGDGDGLGDSCDPCVDSDMQTGLDVDGDGVDDGCDSCLHGRNHDEDGDGLGDGCDDCPGSADPDQTDSDRDGIGDACESDTAVQHRVFFDGFGPPNNNWNAGFKPWQGNGDGYEASTPTVGASTYNEGPWNPAAVVTGSSVRIVASVMVPDPTFVVYDQRIGISMRAFLSGGVSATCEIKVEQPNWVQTNDTSMTPLPSGLTRFELDLVPSSTPGYVSGTCTVGGVSITPNVLYSADTLNVPSLVSNVSAEFEWIDVIQ